MMNIYRNSKDVEAQNKIAEDLKYKEKMQNNKGQHLSPEMPMQRGGNRERERDSNKGGYQVGIY
jgi:hypothetical protein